jgi:hypothetical protein
MATIYQDKESGNWTGSQLTHRKETITYASSVAFVAAGATAALALDAHVNIRYMAATGACTFTAPTSGIAADTELHIYVLTDGTDRTMTFGTGFECHPAAGTKAIESNTTGVFKFVYNQAETKFIEVSSSFTTAS